MKSRRNLSCVDGRGREKRISEEGESVGQALVLVRAGVSITGAGVSISGTNVSISGSVGGSER